MGKKKKAACPENKPRVEGAAHVKYQFNSQTFERLLVTVQGFDEGDEVFRNKDISINITTKGFLDAAIKFELCEFKKDLKQQVTMHLYLGTTTLMVQGNSGRILNKPPFLCFADVFLELLIAGEDVALGKRMRRNEEEVKRSEQELKVKREEKKQQEEEQELKIKEEKEFKVKREKEQEWQADIRPADT